jgi:hypothetical protein
MKREFFGLITKETKKYLKDPNFVVFGYVQSKLGLDKKALTEALKDAQGMSVTKVALNYPKTDLEYIIIHSKRCYALIRPDKDYHSGKLFVTIQNYEPYNDNQSMLPSPHQYTIEAKTALDFYHAFVRVHNILVFNDYAVKAQAELAETIEAVTTKCTDDPFLKKGFV